MADSGVEGGVGDRWTVCNACGHAWNDDGRDSCFSCGLTYEQSKAWLVVRASRFEEALEALRKIASGTAPGAATESEAIDDPPLPRQVIHTIAVAVLSRAEGEPEA